MAMRITAITAALALLTAGAAPGAAAEKAKKAWDPDREICKSQGVLGSRLKRVRVCMTAHQWEELKQQEQMGLRRKQYNGAGGCSECGGGQ
jgi:hypothetical protein